MARRTTAKPPVLPGYSYIRPLGSGGFADVFLFEQDMPRRVVAVKVLVDDAVNPDVLRTFHAEADILARLSAHPSIVTIHHASISADGRPYFAMEYCPENMSSQIKRRLLTPAEVLDTGVRIAAALETAHRAGVLHRDIKPSNVLITAMSTPVIADFGIATVLANRDEDPDVVAMSVPWSAPEVLDGRDLGSVATEIWGLGATLYTLLAGRAPFELPSGEKISREQLKSRIMKSKYVPTGRDDVTERFEDVLRRCLEKEPPLRFNSMLALAEELRWAQYDMGLPPTAMDVASAEWVSATAPVDVTSESPRGPVISTVNPNSRRAERAKELASAQRRHEMSPQDRGTRGPSKRKVALTVGGGAIALVAGIVVTLFVLGVF